MKQARPFCQAPDDCQAKGRGVHCRRCSGAAQFRKLNSDPAFRGKGLREYWAKRREFAEAAARLGAHQSHTPVAEANRSDAMMRRIGVPLGAEEIYRFGRRKKLTRQEAVALAQRESVARERIPGSI
jgi:hypothetical protein